MTKELELVNKGTRDEVLVIKDPPRGPVQIPKMDSKGSLDWKDWRPLKLN